MPNNLWSHVALYADSIVVILNSSFSLFTWSQAATALMSGLCCMCSHYHEEQRRIEFKEEIRKSVEQELKVVLKEMSEAEERRIERHREEVRRLLQLEYEIQRNALRLESQAVRQNSRSHYGDDHGWHHDSQQDSRNVPLKSLSKRRPHIPLVLQSSMFKENIEKKASRPQPLPKGNDQENQIFGNIVLQ